MRELRCDPSSSAAHAALAALSSSERHYVSKLKRKDREEVVELLSLR